jgi:hypothetical protein
MHRGKALPIKGDEWMDERLSLVKAENLEEGDLFAVAFDGFDSLAIPCRDSEEEGKWFPYDISGNRLFPDDMPKNFNSSTEIAEYMEAECDGVVVSGENVCDNFGGWDLAVRMSVHYKNVLQWTHQRYMGVAPTEKMKNRKRAFLKIVDLYNESTDPEDIALYIKFRADDEELSGYLTWMTGEFDEEVIVEDGRDRMVYVGPGCGMSDIEVIPEPPENQLT